MHVVSEQYHFIFQLLMHDTMVSSTYRPMLFETCNQCSLTRCYCFKSLTWSFDWFISLTNVFLNFVISCRPSLFGLPPSHYSGSPRIPESQSWKVMESHGKAIELKTLRAFITKFIQQSKFCQIRNFEVHYSKLMIF